MTPIDDNELSHNSKAARSKALAALETAKKLERKQIRQGAIWIQQGKTFILKK